MIILHILDVFSIINFILISLYRISEEFFLNQLLFRENLWSVWVVHICNPRTQKAEARGLLQIQNHYGLHSKFQGYSKTLSPCISPLLHLSFSSKEINKWARDSLAVRTLLFSQKIQVQFSPLILWFTTIPSSNSKGSNNECPLLTTAGSRHNVIYIHT